MLRAFCIAVLLSGCTQPDARAEALAATEAYVATLDGTNDQRRREAAERMADAYERLADENDARVSDACSPLHQRLNAVACAVGRGAHCGENVATTCEMAKLLNGENVFLRVKVQEGRAAAEAVH